LDDVDPQIKDVIDIIRAKEEVVLTTLNAAEPIEYTNPKLNMSLDGHGVMFVAQETLNDTMPLCLGLGETQHKVRLVPCFHEWVPQTLAPDWETGAIILEETPDHNRFEIGPCSSDGNLNRM
jgi:hypothetical protein